MKIRQAIKIARENVITCEDCLHPVRSHYLPGAASMTVRQITVRLTAVIPLGSRHYCWGTTCADCERDKSVPVIAREGLTSETTEKGG